MRLSITPTVHDSEFTDESSSVPDWQRHKSVEITDLKENLAYMAVEGMRLMGWSDDEIKEAICDYIDQNMKL